MTPIYNSHYLIILIESVDDDVLFFQLSLFSKWSDSL